MKPIKFLIAVSLFVSSCTSDNELTIVFPRGDGLSRDTRVLLNGLMIGRMKSIEIGPAYEIEATVTLDDEIKISDDSKFILTRSMFGSGTIDITAGSSNKYFVNGQKVKGQLEKVSESHDDALGGLITKFFKPYTEDGDSVLIELRRLNSNLEQIMKKPE